MAMPTGNGENPEVYRQWTIDDPQNYLLTDLSAWISKFVNLKKPGYCATFTNDTLEMSALD